MQRITLKARTLRPSALAQITTRTAPAFLQAREGLGGGAIIERAIPFGAIVDIIAGIAVLALIIANPDALGKLIGAFTTGIGNAVKAGGARD